MKEAQQKKTEYKWATWTEHHSKTAPPPCPVQKSTHLIRLASSDSYMRATESRQNGSQRSQIDATALQYWSGVDTGRSRCAWSENIQRSTECIETAPSMDGTCVVGVTLTARNGLTWQEIKQGKRKCLAQVKATPISEAARYYHLRDVSNVGPKHFCSNRRCDDRCSSTVEEIAEAILKAPGHVSA